MSTMDIDIGPIQSPLSLSNLSTSKTIGSNDCETKIRTELLAAARDWASQREAEIQKDFFASVAQQNSILEQQAAEWKANELAQYERHALAWRTREEEEVKNCLEARLAELKQHAESEHARIMAQEKAEHARVLANERARTAEAKRISQARAVEMGRLRKEEEKLRGVIKTHEEAAKSQQQGAQRQSTQVQSLEKSLAERDVELQEKSCSNTQLQQELARSQTKVMSSLLWGSRKDVEIASLKQDKSTLIRQGQSAIAAKDATIKDLTDRLAAQSQRLQTGQTANDKLDRIAKDLTEQKGKLQRESSKLDTELEEARDEIQRLSTALKKAKRQVGKDKSKKDVAKLMGAMALGPSSGNAIAKRPTAPPPARRARRQRRRPDETDSESQAMDESDG